MVPPLRNFVAPLGLAYYFEHSGDGWRIPLPAKTGHENSLARTLRAAVDPGLHQLSGCLLATRSRFATFAWIPGPGDEIVFGDMLLQCDEVAAAVELDILQLMADFTQ